MCNLLKANLMNKLPAALPRVLVVCLALVCAVFVSPSIVQASKSGLAQISLFDDVRESPPLYIPLGKAELIDVEGAVADVLVANPGIVDVVAVQANRLYVVGLQVGDTNLIVLDDAGDVVKRLDLHVNYDLKAIQSLVDSLFPEETVKIAAVHDQILITGTVSTAENAGRITKLLAAYVSDLQELDGVADELITNMIEVRGEQQVMLQVRIVEASRSVAKELGIELNTSGATNLNTSLIGATSGGIGLINDAAGVFTLLQDTKASEIGILDLELSALEEEGLVNILAEPNLTAVSGQQAGFLAGGEFPVPTGRDQDGNVVIDFREFGVALNFRPVVLSESRISLNLRTEVSSLDFTNAVVLAGLTVPGLDVRRAETTVEVQSGGSLMIAGLLQSSAVKNMAGLPGIRNTPILGDLISSDNFQRDESELIIIITPYLVTPYAERARKAAVEDQRKNPLAALFAANIRRAFALREDEEDLFSNDNRYGYLLD